MTRAGRVKRLKELIAEIESLPASVVRDRLLSEFRSRAVDVDTGVAPRAMLPMAERAPDAVRAVRLPPKSSHVPRVAAEPLSPAPADGREEGPGDRFGVADWLSLDDPAPAPVRTRGGRAVPPWTLGLRG